MDERPSLQLCRHFKREALIGKAKERASGKEHLVLENPQ
jgi:hypothetical protein